MSPETPKTKVCVHANVEHVRLAGPHAQDAVANEQVVEFGDTTDVSRTQTVAEDPLAPRERIGQTLGGDDISDVALEHATHHQARHRQVLGGGGHQRSSACIRRAYFRSSQALRFSAGVRSGRPDDT